ncbi:MAG: F0F1 ATP synthase subunit delta [Methylococcus sp.]|jgi:F-type H+-transporting ATPase subunit delta|nr:MAG: F0F1 ATP synthase subunit delta [Methylococcus sp.]
MSERVTLARPYAVAAYKRATETGTADQWSGHLAFLSALMADQRVQAAASNPKVRREALVKAFLALCEGRLDPEGENFLRLLIENNRLFLVSDIAGLFERYRADHEGYVNVDVATAYELTPGEKTKLTKTLNKVLGKEARLKVSVDRSLIGGVYIRAGDRVIDASVRGQIERLAKSLWN